MKKSTVSGQQIPNCFAPEIIRTSKLDSQSLFKMLRVHRSGPLYILWQSRFMEPATTVVYLEFFRDLIRFLVAACGPGRVLALHDRSIDTLGYCARRCLEHLAVH